MMMNRHATDIAGVSSEARKQMLEKRTLHKRLRHWNQVWRTWREEELYVMNPAAKEASHLFFHSLGNRAAGAAMSDAGVGIPSWLIEGWDIGRE
jgi:hypothetical protein